MAKKVSSLFLTNIDKESEDLDAALNVRMHQLKGECSIFKKVVSVNQEEKIAAIQKLSSLRCKLHTKSFEF